ncbi:CaiB/BaiF CoA transferase family protein [Ponticaulis profundi]|uniref:CaiB/BaiF CoA transferase family protein n=1 Tax=Ponticaulis profundi TaxID=2665222 RepID=A0ABW1S8L5_9PROT
MQEATGPLKGLRVIELGVLLAGPFCGQLLGDMGAEVIKVEPPGQPDPLREWGQVKPDDKSLWFPVVGRNKKMITLNLRHEDGQNMLKDLVAKSDILVENFRPGTMEKWGLGYDVLKAINPGLIMVRISGYGQTGPNAKKAGYASVGEAFGGMRYVMGEPDRMPSRAGISLGDSLAATFGAMGALAALQHRNATGQGQMVDSAIYEACLSMMESLVPEYGVAGHIRERTGSFLPKIAPSNVYPASDGMMIIAANQDTVWRRLAEAMGRPELADDPKFKSHVPRGENQAEIDALISDWSRKLTQAEIADVCEAHGVPCGPIYTGKEMMDDPHYAARESITQVPHPHFGTIPMQNVFPKFSETPGNIRWSAPETGAHNEEIYGDLLGRSDDDLNALKESGTI